MGRPIKIGNKVFDEDMIKKMLIATGKWDEPWKYIRGSVLRCKSDTHPDLPQRLIVYLSRSNLLAMSKEVEAHLLIVSPEGTITHWLELGDGRDIEALAIMRRDYNCIGTCKGFWVK